MRRPSGNLRQADDPTTEADLRLAILCGRAGRIIGGELVTDCRGDCLAHLGGWSGMYLTALKSRHSWATPARGDLGPGWPDLTLVHPRRGLIFAELKRQRGKLSAHQVAVITALTAAGQLVYVWRPSDLDDGTIWRALMGPHGARLRRVK